MNTKIRLITNFFVIFVFISGKRHRRCVRLERNRSNGNALAVVGQRHVSVAMAAVKFLWQKEKQFDRVIVVVELELKFNNNITHLS